MSISSAPDYSQYAVPGRSSSRPDLRLVSVGTPDVTETNRGTTRVSPEIQEILDAIEKIMSR